ncbi:MAG: ribonuclease E/G [Chlamydiia bacterium]|nr:ribonuclease E/G [Chlamydiia bacterium]
MNTFNNSIIIHKNFSEITYATIINDVVKHIEISRDDQKAGCIYSGYISNFLDKISSLFVKIENGSSFLRISDLVTSKHPISGLPYKTQSKEKILVQVQHDGEKAKAPKVTTKVKIIGRYLVIIYSYNRILFSKNIKHKNRSRLTNIIKDLTANPANVKLRNFGVIFRTAASDASVNEISQEIKHLLKKWDTIIAKFSASTKATKLGIGESKKLEIISKGALQGIKSIYCNEQSLKNEILGTLKEINRRDIAIRIVPGNLLRLSKLTQMIPKLINQKVTLPSGGHLSIDNTEALTTIDVNSGKDVTRSPKKSQKTLEMSLLSINLEAVKVIASQILLRNIGGIIIIDFIDVKDARNQQSIVNTLEKHLNEGSNIYSISKMSKIGLVEITRQRKTHSIYEILTSSCPCCHGHSKVYNHETVFLKILQNLKDITFGKADTVSIKIHPGFSSYVRSKNLLSIITKQIHPAKNLTLSVDGSVHVNHASITINNKKPQLLVESPYEHLL